MAPKAPFKVQSLNAHLEKTRKGISAEAQQKRQAASRAALPLKKDGSTVDRVLFGNDNDSDAQASESDSSSDEDNGADFMKMIKAGAGQGKQPAASEPPPRKIKVTDGDTELNAKAQRPAPAGKLKNLKVEPHSSDEASDSASSGEDEDEKTRPEQVNGGIKKAPSSNVTSKSASGKEDEDAGRSNSSTSSSTSSTSSASSTSSDGSDEVANDEHVSKTTSLAAQRSDPSPATKPTGGDVDKDKSKGKRGDRVKLSQDQPAPATNGHAKKTATRKSGLKRDDSSDDDDDDDEDENRGGVAGSKEGEEKAEMGISRRWRDDAEESRDQEGEAADESIHIEDRQANRKGVVGASHFRAPDFVLRRGNHQARGEEVARICEQASLEGKQFWYFTVPSSVPISVVQNLEIPLDQAQRGEHIFTHAGEDYGISFNSMTPRSSSSFQILIPSADDDAQYQRADGTAASQQIDQVVRIRRVTQLASIPATGPEQAPPPRAQPEDLKARWQPIGVPSPARSSRQVVTMAEQDVEMAETLPRTVTPQRAKQTDARGKEIKDKEKREKKERKERERKEKKKVGDGGKRKLSDAAAEQALDADAAVHAKRKRNVSEDDDAAAAEQLIMESQRAEEESTAKKRKTQRTESVDAVDSTPTTSGKLPRKETPIMPPKIPDAAGKFSSQPATATATAAVATKPAASRKETAVPLPTFLSSVRPPKTSPVPVPVPSTLMMTPVGDKGKAAEGKKKKKRKSGKVESGGGGGEAARTAVATLQQQSPPPSAQPTGRKEKRAAAVKAPRPRGVS